MENKTIDKNRAAEIGAEYISSGRKLVFTNGCFDILHPGHIELLTKSRELGDALMVALNTDSSVSRLKGPTRPILGERDREIMMSALCMVDYIVFFDEQTPIDLIAAVKPSVLVKGSDYTVDGVVGKDVVESYGGEVRLVELVEGFSTSALIEKIKNMD